MRQVSLLLLIPPPSDQQRSHVLQILEIVDSDFDILDLLLRNLGVVVEVLVSLQHSKWEPNFESISFVPLLWLKNHVSPKQVDRKKNCLLFNIVVLQWTSVSFLFLRSGENCRKTSLLCFPQRVLCFEELFLPFCCGPREQFFLMI